MASSQEVRDVVCILVLGRKLLPGDKPSPELIERVRIASQQLVQHRAGGAVLLVTGGLVQTGAVASEASVMVQLAIENGVVEEEIIVEDRAYNTVENACLARIELHKRMRATKTRIRRILLVTSWFHMSRSLRIFRRIFGTEFGVIQGVGSDESSLTDQQIMHELSVEQRMLGKLDRHLAEYKERGLLMDLPSLLRKL